MMQKLIITEELLKLMLKDYNGAISDFTKAIEINPNYALLIMTEELLNTI